MNTFLKCRVNGAPRTFPYFDAVVGLAWSYDPESYAGGSIAVGRVRTGQRW
jgi:hypothetical protein